MDCRIKAKIFSHNRTLKLNIIKKKSGGSSGSERGEIQTAAVSLQIETTNCHQYVVMATHFQEHFNGFDESSAVQGILLLLH